MAPITLFLCGDVMTGRGIDQILPHPGDPILYEPYMTSAESYVRIAEEATGPIPRPADFSYIWGDALAELERVRPDLRVINLETAVTRSEAYWEGKGINYRMHPDNLPCITAAGVDCCVLANNHVLDWGYPGLVETLENLEKAGLRTAGAGQTLRQAQAPAVLEAPGKGRVLVFAWGSESSGVPWDWAATDSRPGVNLLKDFSDGTVDEIADQVRGAKQTGDLAIASIHWGGNWGYQVPREQREFAHKLVDRAGIDVIHGHSSHHPKGIEVYKGRPILYGCGDFLNDYEGIAGYEWFRGDLTLMYFVEADPATGELLRLRMTPMQIRHFRLNRASGEDARWLRETLDREGAKLGTAVDLDAADGTLALKWGG
jgi:poly-gamma-glutamate capsule biosynthesis protein CapA/YwtB (metallophosphatase superfamily)